MATTLSASAAIAAAVISLATLLVTTLVTGHREQRKWVRDSLTDAFTAFLDASWRGSDAMIRSEDPDPAYADMRSQLTRLRLLASPAVVAAGEELLRRQRAAMVAAAADRGPALAGCSTARRDVIAAARKQMDLR
ncbi:hypothetical protein AB0F72_28370 [Actinoplanes sp. NPDC023936]|uniref:hypothetical protein n=1 Tax=Actinoplanes sp. NPDC023936 TaxID=3154910 RepID=UPI0033E855B9